MSQKCSYGHMCIKYVIYDILGRMNVSCNGYWLFKTYRGCLRHVQINPKGN